MRAVYSCHDSLPSSDTNTQQLFWTVLEVARLGAQVDLLVPSAAPGGLAAIAAHYGAKPGSVPETLTLTPVGDAPAASVVAKGRFDWRVPEHVRPTGDRFLWTRDVVAAAAAARARLPFVFETYRPDLATRAAFFLWRRVCLTSPAFRGLIAHSRLAADAFRAAGVPADRVLVAHNGFAPSLMTPALDRAAARRRLGLAEEGQIVVYAGHSGPEKGVDALVRTAAAAPAIRFLVLGVEPDSDEAQAIADHARVEGATNLILKPRVPVADVAPYLYAADCLIVPPTEGPLKRSGCTVLPMKVFTYLAAGRPILAPRLPDIEEVLTDGETARLVPPDDPAAAATALAHLLGDQSLQTRLAENSRRLSAEYTWEARARRLVDFFKARGLLGVH